MIFYAMSAELKPGAQHEAGDVWAGRREEVVHAENFVATGQQSLAQMGT
jgi:hypothetical protein